MSTIAIIGAGELGSTLAFTLARRNHIDSIKLIDSSEGIAAGQALDISQAGPIEGFRTAIKATGNLSEVVGADVIVLTHPAKPSKDQGSCDEELVTVCQLVKYNPHATIVCAEADHRILIARGLNEAGVAREKLIGSAPGALVSALRIIIAAEAGCSPSNVSISIHGVPPEHVVVAWSSATIDGRPIENVFNPPALVRVRARIANLWPPGPYALASAGSLVCEAIATDSCKLALTCFAAADKTSKAGIVTAAVRLGQSGIREIVEPVLSPIEQVQLDTALNKA
jgi:malate dehydrogenase